MVTPEKKALNRAQLLKNIGSKALNIIWELKTLYQTTKINML